MTKSQLLKSLLSACAIAVIATLASSTTADARQMGNCDTSGAYTDRLCDGDHLDPGAYIYSPNGRYRLYYGGDGHALIYDTIDPDNWVNTCTLEPPHSDPGKFMYTESSGVSGHPVGWVILDDYNVTVRHVLSNYTVNGQSYLQVSNSGLVEHYDDDGFINQLHSCYI